MSMTLTAHRTIPSQRRWVWKSEKPFNLPGTILEKCGQSFSICLAWIFISCPLMNRKHSKGFVKIARYQKQSGQLPTQEKMKTAVVRMDFPTTAVNLGDNIHFLFFCYWSCEVHPLRNASCNSILPRKNKVNY